jgi:hypothetical protein
LSGIPSGFTKLDRLTSGWQESDLIIVAARPGMGKTALTLSMAPLDRRMAGGVGNARSHDPARAGSGQAHSAGRTHRGIRRRRGRRQVEPHSRSRGLALAGGCAARDRRRHHRGIPPARPGACGPGAGPKTSPADPVGEAGSEPWPVSHLRPLAPSQLSSRTAGPQLAHWRDHRSALLRAAAVYEFATLQAAELTPPDLVLKLHVSPAVALQRRPGAPTDQRGQEAEIVRRMQ